MALLPSRPVVSIGVVTALGAILVLLAVLQYRWSGQISEADRERMQASLETAVFQFQLEFNRELADLCVAFQRQRPFFSSIDRDTYARRYEDWASTAPDPDIVSGLFLVEAGTDAGPQLLELDQRTSRFEPSDWPPHLEKVRDRLEAESGRLRRFRGMERRLLTCTLVSDVPLLVQPLVQVPSRQNRRFEFPRLAGYLLIELDSDYLQQEFFPDLARRYFGGPEGLLYQVAILSEHNAGKIVYRSDPALSREAFSSPDARVPLLWTGRPPRPPDIREPDRPPRPEREAEGPPRFPFRGDRDVFRGRRFRGAGLVLPSGEGSAWELAVKHPQGSLEAEVARLRRRNLAVSFGVLLLLAAGMAIIVVSSQRAQRLAKLQMEFVAGVSHELRTPLAVIHSAGDNLAEGVVDSGQQVKEYGELIRGEGRRLSGMVEQTLLFAVQQAGGKKYDLRPLRVSEAVDDALEKTESMSQAAGFTVEKHVDPDLPLVKADRAALSQSLQNLLHNALKYGGESRWMAVRAVSAPAGKGSEVQIRVEDKGLGIEPADLPYVFDPFYRGQAATAEQIHGTGLGLSLARDTVVAMGGRMSVNSTPGKGSAFTLHLPALTTAEADSGTGVQPS